MAVALLTTKDRQIADKICRKINILNTERRLLDQKTTQEALKQIQKNREENNITTVVKSTTWHKGIVGIVASRLIETYYRPTIVFSEKNSELVGSARSIQGANIYQILEKCSYLTKKFGGHKYAAGITIESEKYDQFKIEFERISRENY